MATNLSVDPDLIERARIVSGERTKKAAVTNAIRRCQVSHSNIHLGGARSHIPTFGPAWVPSS